jgi:aspartyl-tRNA synthetase
MSTGEIIYWRGPGDYCFSWIGTFTHGYSYVRGTRVWLTEAAGTRYDAQFMGWAIQEEQERMKHKHASIIYGRDSHCMRGRSPMQCIESCLQPISHKAFADEVKRLETTGYPAPTYLKMKNHSKFWLDTKANLMTFYVIHQSDGIKAELAEVERLGIEKGVIFEWL